MKKKITLGFMTLSLLFCGCNSEEKMIQNVAYGYLDAMGNYRIAEAEQFASKETVEGTLKVIENVIMPNMDSTYISRNTPASIEILSIEQENDTTAMVSYKKTTPIKVQEGTLNLIKREDRWQAVVKINLPGAFKMPSDSIAVNKKMKDLENRRFYVVDSVSNKIRNK